MPLIQISINFLNCGVHSLKEVQQVKLKEAQLCMFTHLIHFVSMYATLLSTNTVVN